MKRRYFCPRCDANLNPNVKIILMVRQSERQGLILLSPQPGNYEAILADEITLEEDELADIHCPVCSKSLSAASNRAMAALKFRFSNGREGTVYFSRVVGQQATYFVAEDEVKVYGADATPPVAMNFFGSGHQDVD